MSPLTSKQSCIYCGATDSLTADHVPPKCLFPDPKPSDLITVPACEPCNNSLKLDDEYFRICALSQAYEDPVGEKLWQNKVIGSTLKRSPTLRSALIQKITTVELRSPAGLYLGATPGLKFDRQRVDRVINRTVRGLLWHHYRVKPGADIKFLTWKDPEVSSFQHILNSGTNLSSIGGGVFQYRHSTTIEDSEQSVWFLRFYGKTTFLIVLVRDASSQNSG